jgi:hypothetical protein
MAFSWVPLNCLNPNCSSNAFNNTAGLTELLLALVTGAFFIGFLVVAICNYLKINYFGLK